MELARAGAAPGTRVVAGSQSAGRGRVDHRWESPKGGLYLSLIVRLKTDHPSLLPLLAGADLAVLLRAEFGAATRVKWPNDLVIDGGSGSLRKIGGVLVDRLGRSPPDEAAVIGVGLNVTTPAAGWPAELASRVAVLAEFAPSVPSLRALEDAVVRTLESSAATLTNERATEDARARCRRELYGVGRRATVDGRPAGTITGLGDDGELILDTGTDRVAIRAGEVRVDEVA